LARRALLALLATLAAAPAARAADPIMPLSEVRSGMHCTGLSVVRGTEIASFDVGVIDTIAPEAGLTGARILIRVSGPAVDATGVGPGFSGSPIYCDGRNVGAISESIGEYGNHVVLATPIEDILSANPTPAPRGAKRSRAAPRGAKRSRAAPRSAKRSRAARRSAAARPARSARDARIARSARPLVAPLTATGLAPRTRALLARVARKAGRTLLAAPPGPVGGFAQQPLVPGAAVAASLASGDLALGAIGTVAYRDGDRVWAFGHPLDGLGPRSLFLQDAYVFSVIGNPVGVPDLGAQTYKLTTGGGHTQGAVLNDTASAIAGVVGREPSTLALHVAAHVDGRTATLDAKLADERRLGLGAGLSLLAPLAASSALESLVRSDEAVRLDLCVRFRIARREPLRLCNRYFSTDAALEDLAGAASLVESFDLPTLPLRRTDVRVRAARGIDRDVIVGASVPGSARPGTTTTLRVRVRRRGSGAERTLRLPLHVPRGTRPGVQTLLVKGTGEGPSVSLAEELLDGFELLLGDEPETPSEPRSYAGLVAQVRALHRPLGIVARFRGGADEVVEPSQSILYEGRLRTRVRVVTLAR
jgi:hypothetical protein